jgi:DNA anti-recombination protein RmuC
VPHFLQQIGSVLLKHSKDAQNYLWRIVTYCNMMSARTRQGSNAIKKIEELRLNKKKKNNEIQKHLEEEEKQKKDKE